MVDQYTTRQGDTWDAIAFALYGAESQASALLEANPAYRRTVVFSAGAVLSVPPPPARPAALLPPWRRA